MLPSDAFTPGATVNILFSSTVESPGRWLPLLEQALPQDRFFLEPRDDIEVALVASPPEGTLAQLPNLKLVQSLWMGVDKLLHDPSLARGVPVARLIDPGMIAAMTETVLAHVLDWHRLHFRYREQQIERVWQQLPQVMASERTIGILGLGELGSVVAQALATLGFRVLGWSRRLRELAGVQYVAELGALLERSDLVVCLLPLTHHTRGILNADAFAQMPEGACLINVGRGEHVVEKDLREALDSRWITHAYLDVFETEPLEMGHPFWRHPSVTLTPHCAALTEPRTAFPKVVANIERLRRGEPLEGLVDVAAGY
jgi:glyoxylate/hydroxypyruvate reductase A